MTTMTAKPTIHPMAAQHLRELRERWGVEPTLDESIWIVQLCERVLCPTGDRADLCGVPVRVGVSSVWLWPMTIGASIFVQDYMDRWFRADNSRGALALAWVLAHARDSKTLLAAARGREIAEKMIDEWATGLTCTTDELYAAIDTILPPDPCKADTEGTAKTGSINWPDIIRELETIAGIPADHWLWDMSRNATVNAWQTSRAVIAAQCGRSTPRIMGEMDVALQDLAKAKEAIILAHRKDIDEQGS
jgi:hypothetical protein